MGATAVGSILLPLLLAGGSDVYFEQTTVSFVDHHLAGPGVFSRVFHAGRKMRLETGSEGPRNPALVLRLDLSKAYRIDPASHTVEEVDAQALRSQSQMDLSMAGTFLGEGSTPRTTELEGRKTIASHSCRGFRIRSGGASLELYVTSEIPLGIDAFLEFLDWSGATQSLGGILGEIRNLPGFPLETRSTVKLQDHVHETVSTVTKVVVGPIPSELFEVPAGYEIHPETR